MFIKDQGSAPCRKNQTNFTIQRQRGKSLKNSEDHMMQNLVKWKQ